MRELWEYIRHYKDPQSGEELATAFVRLPSQGELPIYYSIISHPRDLAGVELALRDSRYAEPAAFVNDMLLIFHNAQVFNEEASEIFQNATVGWGSGRKPEE